MSYRTLYAFWIALAALASIASGVALLLADERTFGMFGIAAGAFHVLWALDVPARLRGRWRRRPIMIPTLRPVVVSPPRRGFAQRLCAWRRRRG